MKRPTIDWNAPYYNSINVRANNADLRMPVIADKEGNEVRLMLSGRDSVFVNIMPDDPTLSVGVELTRAQWWAMKSALATWEMNE